MNDVSPSAPRISIARRLFYSHLLAGLLVSIAVSAYFYSAAKSDLKRNAEAKVLASAVLTAQSLDANELRTLKVATDAKSPAFGLAVAQLQKLVAVDTRIRWAYVFRLEDHALRYVVASNPQLMDMPVGEAHPGPPPAAMSDGLQKPSLSPSWKSDGKQQYVAAFAPLRNGEGEYVLGLDVYTEEVEQRLAELRRNALLSFLIAVALASLFGSVLGRVARRVIARVVEICRKIADGDLNQRLQFHSGDELNELASAFNDMASRLQRSQSEREQALVQLRGARDRMELNIRERTTELDKLNIMLREEAERRSQIEARLAEAAATDALTKLLNRRAMQQLIVHVVERSQKQARFFCIAVLDIDYFKKINDQYGHAMGDKVLQAISALLRRELATDEAAARWGGEEFLLLWPNNSISASEHRANRIRELIAAQPPVPEGPAVTVSIGIAEYTGLEDVERCLLKADRALYRAKDEGRNRVCIGL
jgi:diguanylate cyclase (GGDEF)-like protein